MWIISNLGFVSLVQHSENPDYIRARARRFEHLQETFDLFDGDVIDLGPDCPDYRFHANIPRLTVAHKVYDAITAISYHSHVKEEVARGDQVFYQALLGCWRELYALQDPPLDTASSASRQHYIDTGRYLTEADRTEQEIDWWAGDTPTLGDLGEIAERVGDLADKMRAVGHGDRPLAEQEIGADDLVDDDYEDYGNPAYVVGAVIAQCEDLTRAEALDVLTQARAAVESWDR
jgi:hypothetical protein